MTAAGLLTKTANPTDADIDEAMHGNVCRCGTYQSIRKAVHLAARYQAAANGKAPTQASNSAASQAAQGGAQ
jgi:isoquinoline 1-oxidoreductase alpha subunit